MNPDSSNFYAFRLKPGDDLRRSIELFTLDNNIKAGWVASCVGSLTEYSIRFANQQQATIVQGHFEILSLNGTISSNGCHLHICINDHLGNTIGGHLLEGCKIYTTAEIILQTTNKYRFNRKTDISTGWKELDIEEQQIFR
jgi:uncharacterized protein